MRCPCCGRWNTESGDCIASFAAALDKLPVEDKKKLLVWIAPRKIRDELAKLLEES